jgi:nucleoside-diphosphate-sugar epimerase
MSIFFTGFPGFLGSALLPRVAARREGEEILCLVQPKFMAAAGEALERLTAAEPSLKSRVSLLAGDIATPGLGVAPALARSLREVWHLAAIYDLSVPRDAAMRVNVDGTANVLAFAAAADSLERLHYVSTCYVSGRYPGRFMEDDLEKGQTFNNFYEETKYLAEVRVRAAMREGLPATIYRPAVVTGDSATGATQKYDGPYYAIRWIVKQPRVAVMPVIGAIEENSLNVVPRDWLIDAVDRLAGMEASCGVTYQLADPDPPSIREMLEAIGNAAGKRILRVPLPRGLAKWSIDRVPGVFRLMRIPSSAVDYFVHPTRYDTTNAARDLAGSGLSLPRFREYCGNLVRYVEAHPDVPSVAMA